MERDIERRFRLKVKLKGGLCLKLITPGFVGIPDRLCILPGARLIFIEFKFGRGKCSIRQEAVHRILCGLGFEVWVVNETNINEYLEKL